MAARGVWTRRDAVRGGVVVAAAGAFGSLPARTALASVPALPEDDAGVLERVLEIEQALAVTYEAAAGGDLLDVEVEEAARLFAEQEREHVEALTAALVDLGGTAPKAPGAEQIEGLQGLDSQPALLEFLIGLEREAIAIYDAAATMLVAPGLLRTGAQIVCNEAQHLVVLRQQLGEQAVPAAFERGIARQDGSIPSGR